MSDSDKPHFGIFILTNQPPWVTDTKVIHNALDQIKLADELGFEAAWVAEHNARVYGIVASGQVLLAAAAGATNRIKLGAAVTRLPLHHPLRVAEDFALLDQISKGRVYWGFGRGYDTLEFDAYNIPIEERDERYEEALEIVLQAWREHKVSHKGKHYTIPAGDVVDSIELFPKPYQSPHPPIFTMISQSDSSVVWAAERGLNFILGANNDWDGVKHKVELYRKEARLAGHTFDLIDANIARAAQLKMVHVAETTEQAVREYERGLMWYMDVLANRGMFGFSIEQQPYEYYVEHKSVFLGSPDKVIEELQDFRKHTGLGGLIGWFDPGSQPPEQVLSSMRMFSERVIPNV